MKESQFDRLGEDYCNIKIKSGQMQKVYIIQNRRVEYAVRDN
jgi:hypothetical protein